MSSRISRVKGAPWTSHYSGIWRSGSHGSHSKLLWPIHTKK